jgi:TonB-linked SusC/RagA family outer membrane protein
MKTLFIYFLLLIPFGQTVFSQTAIAGSVLDSQRSPLPGVSILIKGTTTGTTTDFDGNYSLNAKQGDVLVFTYIGFVAQEIPVKEQRQINVVLQEDIAQLNEVVVVGYGTQKKSDITGSVASFDTERLEKLPQTNIEQALQGTLPGVSISVNSNTASGGSNSLSIRGQRSISGGSSPLIVLDGIVFSGSLTEINMNDIKSLEVLKDASSSAIYGARGANGVILITTKKGEKGKVRMNLSTFYGTDQPYDLPDMMDAETFYKRKVERFGEDELTDTEREVWESGQFVDWVDLILRNGARAEHNISLSGGGDKVNYFISGNFQEIEGVAINDNFSKSNFRINLEIQPTDWLKIGTNTLLGFSDADGFGGDFEEAFLINPLTRAFNDDGSLTEFPWPEDTFFRNALESTRYSNQNDANSLVTNNYIDVKLPIEGLSYKLNTGFTKRNVLQQTYRGIDTRRGREVGGYANQVNTTSEDWLIENIINYEKSFGDHNLFLTGLYSAQQEQFESLSLTGEGFPNDVRGVYQFNNADVLTANPNFVKSNHISQMLRLNYNYKSKYLLTLTGRRDGYSAFGNDTKYGTFPSMALGWNIHKENFLKDNSVLNGLKLRFSYGENGNEAISAFRSLAQLSSLNYTDGSGGTLFGFFPNSLANTDLGWETTTSYNYGIDFKLFKSRIEGSVDYFTSVTDGLLLSKSIPSINGATSIIQNIGETKGSGIEIALNSHNITTDNFSWDTQMAFTHSSNEIVNVGLKDDEGNFIDDVGSRWFLGEEVSVNYGYVIDGIWQLDEVDGVNLNDYAASEAGDVKYKDLNGDEKIDDEDRTVIGSRQPDFTLGMTNTFTYKNFSLNVFFHWVEGVTKRNSLITTNDFNLRRRTYNVNYWSPDNPTNDFPENADRSTNTLGAAWYEDASFIRLKDVTLNYAFSQQVLDKLSLSRLELFFNAKNLVTITDWRGIDPEASNQTDRPFSRTFLLGLRLGL